MIIVESLTRFQRLKEVSLFYDLNGIKPEMCNREKQYTSVLKLHNRFPNKNKQKMLVRKEISN
jgi:hypothetical protein